MGMSMMNGIGGGHASGLRGCRTADIGTDVKNGTAPFGGGFAAPGRESGGSFGGFDERDMNRPTAPGCGCGRSGGTCHRPGDCAQDAPADDGSRGGCMRGQSHGCGREQSHGGREQSCGCGSRNAPEAGGRCAGGLMQEIRETEFAIDELVLYLDAYPDCRQALAMYRELLEKRNALVGLWERKYGPLTRLGNESRTSWDWTARPFPWEPEANE